MMMTSLDKGVCEGLGISIGFSDGTSARRVGMRIMVFMRKRRPPRSTREESSAASDVYERQKLLLKVKLNSQLKKDSLELSSVRKLEKSEIHHSEYLMVNLES